MNLDNIGCALSRYDIASDGHIRFNEFLAPWSQDVWIFKNPVPDNAIQYSNFLMGLLGCDNRIAFEWKRAGLTVLNPCSVIITRHLHASEKRNYTKDTAVRGEYASVTPI